MIKQLNSLLWRPSYGRKSSLSLNLPLRIEFVITSACNGRCIMCEYQPGGRMMPFDQFRKMAQRSLPVAKETFLIGGEPLLHPDFYRMSEFAHRRKTKLFATTNLSRLEKRHLDAFRNYFKGLTVSVDSMIPAVYESIRPGLSFKTLRKNLAAVSKITEVGLKVNIAAVAFRKNISALPELVNLVSDLGFDRLIINFATIRQGLKLSDSLLFHRELSNDSFNRVRERAGKLNVSVSMPENFDLENPVSTGDGLPTLAYRRCANPWYLIRVLTDGTVVPCCILHNQPMGRLTEDTLAHIWNGRAYRLLRRGFRCDSPEPPWRCRHCRLIGKSDANDALIHVPDDRDTIKRLKELLLKTSAEGERP